MLLNSIHFHFLHHLCAMAHHCSFKKLLLLVCVCVHLSTHICIHILEQVAKVTDTQATECLWRRPGYNFVDYVPPFTFTWI